MNSIFRNILVWIVLGSLLIYVFDNIENSTAREQISYSQFKEEILSDRIAKVIFQGDQMTITGDRLDGSKFETVHPIFKKDDAVDRAIEENGIIAVYEKIEQPSIWSQAKIKCVALGEGQMAPHLQKISERLNQIGYDGSMSLESVYRPTEGNFEDGFNASITKFKNMYS